MSAKEVKFSVDARDRMLHGIDTLTHAVRVTLGPKGRNVLLDESFGAPRMTKDGLTVAKEIEPHTAGETATPQTVRRSMRPLAMPHGHPRPTTRGQGFNSKTRRAMRQPRGEHPRIRNEFGHLFKRPPCVMQRLDWVHP